MTKRFSLTAVLSLTCLVAGAFAAEKRAPSPAPPVDEISQTDLAAVTSFPRACFIPTDGTGENPANRRDSGCFRIAPVLNSACWTRKNREYYSVLMWYAGENTNVLLYNIVDQNKQLWRVEIAKQEDATYKDHEVWLDSPGSPILFEHFGYFVKID